MDFLDKDGVRLEIGDYVKYHRLAKSLEFPPEFYVIYEFDENEEYHPIKVFNPITGKRNGLYTEITKFIRKYEGKFWLFTLMD